MSKKTLVELRIERTLLLERIAVQRQTLRQQLAPVQRASDVTDRFNDLLARAIVFVKTNPQSLAAVGLLVALVKPRSAWRWAKRGFMLWRTAKVVRQFQPQGWLNILRRFI
jgi:hypothetical protein